MRLVHLITIFPCVAMLLGVVLHNKVFPLILGLPFPLGWITIWIVITSAIMLVVYNIDPNNKTQSGGDDQ